MQTKSKTCGVSDPHKTYPDKRLYYRDECRPCSVARYRAQLSRRNREATSRRRAALIALNEKTCTKCGETKPYDRFKGKGTNRWGQARKSSHCKDCINKRRRELHPPKNREVFLPRKSFDNAHEMRIATLVRAARKRAGEKRLDFTLTTEDVKRLAKTTVCAITGLKFNDKSCRVRGAAHPLSPSLDRKNPERGYVRENVRVISHWANMAKSTMTERQFKEMLRAASKVIH